MAAGETGLLVAGDISPKNGNVGLVPSCCMRGGLTFDSGSQE